MPRKKRKSKRVKKEAKKKFNITIKITKKELVIAVFIFLALAFLNPPPISEFGYSASYLVLYIYLFHSVIITLALSFIWENFLRDYVKLRQLHLDLKEKRVKKRSTKVLV